MKKLKAILIGAGVRGTIYTDLMADMPEKYEVIAVAEPNESRREYIRTKHGIDRSMCFETWEPLLALGKIADLAVITTMDRLHFAPAMEALEHGYDILLEKPISPSPEECYQVAEKAEARGAKVVVCHVLRYTPLFTKLKDIIDSGEIGRVMSITHEECVGNIHQSHSFVRGNWGNSTRSSCMLLQKSCHDMDILQWLLGKKVKKVQSFGALTYFTEENAPENAPDRCIEGCPEGENCPYNAVKLYLENKENIWTRRACTQHMDPTDELVERALRETQYGKCVFRCDNDVVDHQTVNLLFEDDTTVLFSMNPFNKGGRFIHIQGTKGEVRAALADDAPIKVFDFRTRETTEIPMSGEDGVANGHGGGDFGIVSTLYDYLAGDYKGRSISTVTDSANNHLIVFAAEKSRLEHTVVDFKAYVDSLRCSD